MKKAMKVLSGMITTVLFIVFLLMVFLVISSKASGGEPQAFGYQFKTVLSGSMEPTFMTGSVIAVQPVENPVATIKENDIITYVQEDESFVTHRVVEAIKNEERTMYRTKGDNNEDADTQPVLAENIRGVYTGITIPYLGYFIDFAKSGKGTAVLLIVPGILLLGYSGVSIYQAIREIEKKAKPQESEKVV
jgi:signal peptidase I